MSKKPSTNALVERDEIQNLVHVVRGQRVMLDSDLARLYGVSTAALNQAVRRNAGRFPEDFAYQLTQQEFTSLISRIVISKVGRGGRRRQGHSWPFPPQPVLGPCFSTGVETHTQSFASPPLPARLRRCALGEKRHARRFRFGNPT